jgi:hypothetical protein
MQPSTVTGKRGRHAAPRLRLLLAAAIASGLLVYGSARAQEAAGRSELILSNLPPKGSKAYKDLLGRAGKDANGQVLGLTQSEVWSMPTSRIDDVIRHGETLGVKMTRLGADYDHVLKPPTAPMSAPQEEMMKSMKEAKETMGVGLMAVPSAAVVEYALMKDADAKSAIGKRPAAAISKIVIPLNDKESITVRRTSVDMKKDGCTWRGEIEGTGEPVILMWWKGGRFNGMFTYHGHMYNLKNMGGEVHAVIETDPGKMPPDHGSMRAQPQSGDVKDDPLVARGEGAMMRPRDRSNLKDRQDSIGGVALPKLDETAKSVPPKIEPLSAEKRNAMATKNITIDVMVLYTNKVRSKYLDIDKDLIALSMEQANESFVNSGLKKIRLRLVHSQLIDYDESDGEHFNHLYRMVDGEDPFKGIRKLRNEKRADVVALIVDDPSGCGLSTRVGADADEAYIVVHQSCAALTYTIAHEIGHIIGARHDVALDNNLAPYPYGHGYVNGKKWRDIMSYKASCDGCPRVPIWSNPTLKYKGDPAGTLEADNARVLLEHAERVSKFR